MLPARLGGRGKAITLAVGRAKGARAVLMLTKHPSRALTDAQRRKATRLHHDGKTYREIVKLMNIQHPKVAKNLLRHLLNGRRRTGPP